MGWQNLPRNEFNAILQFKLILNWNNYEIEFLYVAMLFQSHFKFKLYMEVLCIYTELNNNIGLGYVIYDFINNVMR